MRGREVIALYLVVYVCVVWALLFTVSLHYHRCGFLPARATHAGVVCDPLATWLGDLYRGVVAR